MNRFGKYWPATECCRLRTRDESSIARMRALLRQRFRPLGGRRKASGSQEGTDQHHEQVKFPVHIALRAAIAAPKRKCKRRSVRSAFPMTVGR